MARPSAVQLNGPSEPKTAAEPSSAGKPLNWQIRRMRINKITQGFVVQTWDTELNRWIGQEFMAGDQTEFEAADSDQILDPADIWPTGPEPYLLFHMKQPDEVSLSGDALYVLEIVGDLEPQL